MLTAGPFLTVRFGLVAGGGVLCAALAVANFSRTMTSAATPAASQQAAPKAGDGIAPALKAPVMPPPSFSFGGNQAAAPAPVQPPVAPPKIRAQAVPNNMPAPVQQADDFAVLPSSRRKQTP